MQRQADAMPSRIYHSNHSNRPLKHKPASLAIEGDVGTFGGVGTLGCPYSLR